MNTLPPKRILVAPLDWGLGHTSRCVPIIAHLLSAGVTPVFAGNEWQIRWLQHYFPSIETIPLPGYEIRYSRSAFTLIPYLLWQTPSVLKKIKQEHQWLQRVVKTHSLDAVIADNRYGLYHSTLPTVIITHQLQPAVPLFIRPLVRLLHYQYLGKFGRIWVPDVAGENNLAGELSHPSKIPPQTQYIGWLSHLLYAEKKAEQQPQPHLLVLLSGLEPQRSLLSAKIWQQIQQYEGKVVFVEGHKNVPRKNTTQPIQWYAQLAGEALSAIMSGADWVICRSGYSSIMDLVAMRQKALLIPTPGQTEQTYLARYLSEKGLFTYAPQSNFELKEPKIKPHYPLYSEQQFNLHRALITEWLHSF